jgi:hypothetical protein
MPVAIDIAMGMAIAVAVSNSQSFVRREYVIGAAQ